MADSPLPPTPLQGHTAWGILSGKVFTFIALYIIIARALDLPEPMHQLAACSKWENKADYSYIYSACLQP